MLSRDYYLNKLLAMQHGDCVKIITGIRRCGKSSLLKLFKQHLIKEQGVEEENIIEINYERFENEELRTAEAIHRYIREKTQGRGQCYLLLDEVQEIDDWARVINSLRVSFEVDIYVTGSNSRVFSGEQLTYLSGRYVEVKMYTLSLGEFMRFAGLKNQEQALKEYLRIGAFPAVALAMDESQIEALNAGLFDSIFSRDILLRGKVKDEGRFYKVAKFVADNIGSPVSVNAICNTLKSQGHKLSADAIDNYLSLMCRAYLLFQCERYDIRGKELLRTNGKYYMADLGLRNQLLGYKSGNLGHLLENLVYIELLRQGYQVNVGKFGNGEVDFVVTRGQEKKYIQVALSALEDTTLQRELALFYQIKDNYPKILLTVDRLDLSVDGIRHINAYDFLTTIK